MMELPFTVMKDAKYSMYDNTVYQDLDSPLIVERLMLYDTERIFFFYKNLSFGTKYKFGKNLTVWKLLSSGRQIGYIVLNHVYYS